MRFEGFQALILTGFLTAVGCAHSFAPPQELTEARVAYARAIRGPAAQLNSARLQLAKEALEDAELAYGAKPDQEVRDRAYVALRKIQAAETEAAAQLAAQRRWRALNELASLQGTYAEKARTELASAESRATSAQARATVAEGQVAEEQQARQAAEARANQALAELTRLANVRRETRGLVITLSGQVLFTSGQTTLLPAAQAALDNVVSALKAMPPNAGRVVIEGHTDSRGTRAFNRDLAERRARAVRDYLASRGISDDLFVVEGIGPDRPVADNRSPEGRANNRRVEIVLPPPAFATSTIGTETATPPSVGTPAQQQPPTQAQQPPTQAQQPPTQLPGQVPPPAPVTTPGVPPTERRPPPQPGMPGQPQPATPAPIPQSPQTP